VTTDPDRPEFHKRNIPVFVRVSSVFPRKVNVAASESAPGKNQNDNPGNVLAPLRRIRDIAVASSRQYAVVDCLFYFS
jgi:hypothetical protein